MDYIKRIEIRPRGAVIVYPAFERHAAERQEKGKRGCIEYLHIPRWRHNLNALDNIHV